MAIRKTVLGRIPTLAGAWNANYVNPVTGHSGYPLKKRVTHLGSEFQSLMEDNTYAPATLNNAGTEITFDTTHWMVISNGSDAFLLEAQAGALLTEAQSTLESLDGAVNGKQATISDLDTIRSGAAAGATAYQKPSGGIPSTDMATAVQTSLGLADTAIQAHQTVTDNNPTLAWGQQNKVATIGSTDIHITMPESPTTANNTAHLKVSDTSNNKVSTEESTSSYLQFTGGTNKVTVTDGTNSFDVTITPSVSVTKSDVGLGNVLNAEQIPATEKGAANGVATLDANGLIPSEQLPSYVDDIIDLLAITDTAPSTCAKGDLYFNTTTKKVVKATAADTWGSGATTNTDPEKGKIYLNLSNDKTYRWSGTEMIATPSSDVTGIKVGSSGSTITPSQGVITIPAYETGADVTDAENVKAALNVVTTSAGKYLKDDGTWDTPSNDNTTYTLSVGTGADADKIVLTPSSGSADKITVPYASDAGTVNGKTVAENVPSGAVFTDTTYSTMVASGSSHAGGLVPDTPSTAGTSKYLREDGTWAEPTDTNTTYQLTVNGTAAGDTTSGTNLGSVYAPTSAGTEGQMLIANASGIPAWGSKPSYAYGEIGYEIATQTTSGAVTVNGTKPLHIITLSGAATSVAFSTGNLPAVGHSSHIIFTASSDTTVSIAHVSTGAVRYICPGGENPEDLEVPAGGYVEIDLLRGADTEESNDTVSWIYVRGV